MADESKIEKWIHKASYGDQITYKGLTIIKRQGRVLEFVGVRSEVEIVNKDYAKLQYRRRQARDANFRE